MADQEYMFAVKAAALPVKTSLRLSLAGHDILLCHIDAGLFAVSNVCTHAEALLHEGKLKGHKVLCPLHGAAFDVRDGAALSRPAVTPLCSYSVKISGDDILVAISAAA